MADELLEDYNTGSSKCKAGAVLRELMDDATEQAGSNRDSNEGQEAEILVKWQIPGNLDTSAAKRKLAQVLATLMVAFPGRVTIIDRRQQEWTYHEAENEEQFTRQAENIAIQLHPIKNKEQKVIRWVTITKIRTATTIQEWKGDDEFYSKASEEKIYVFPHPFGYNEWDVVSIGFIKDHHAVHYPRDLLQEKIHTLLQDETNNQPVFQLIPQRITTKDNKATTKAFTVQCLKRSSNQLIHQLTHGKFRQAPNQIFVPFKYKSSQPDLFLQCVRQQNEIYHKTWIIKIEGILPEAMELIAPEILQMKGVLHIVPSKRSPTIGEWKILVDQTKCSFIHRTLIRTWQDLMALVPLEIWDRAPGSFPIPSVSSRKLREYQDDASDIDSYGSLLSVGTTTTQATTEETVLDELPITYQYQSYAAAAGSTESISIASSTQISSPTTSAFIEWQKEKQELENQLQKQASLIEQIQADLQEKISRSRDLEEKLAQALDLAYDRDARHEEMMNKVEMLLNLQQSQATSTAIVATLPSTPVRVNPSPSSPPSKRKNTNATPHRNMYSIFRSNQATSTTTSPNTVQTTQKSQKSPPPTGETRMDIDEEQTTPKPEAESGILEE